MTENSQTRALHEANDAPHWEHSACLSSLRMVEWIGDLQGSVHSGESPSWGPLDPYSPFPLIRAGKCGEELG